MPFTIGGEWIPSNADASTPEAIKVFKKKHRGAWVTVVKNAKNSSHLAKELKQRCACGGVVREMVIELQGDHELLVKKILVEKGLLKAK